MKDCSEEGKTCHLGPQNCYVVLRCCWLALAAAFGCKVSLLGPLLVAFAAVKPGFAGMKWPPHIRKLGPSSAHLLHILGCSLHLLFDEPEAPVMIQVRGAGLSYLGENSTI